MNHTYDYGETVPIHADYRDAESGAVAAQVSAVITITDPNGIEKVTDAAMTEDATATYSYSYALPATGPEGAWKYVTTGTDENDVLTINTVYFTVKAVVIPYSFPENVREILPDLLMSSENLGGVTSGTSLMLTSSALGVPRILKNVTNLYESTDFTFTQPKSITLGIAASGENYTAYINKGFTDEQLIKFISRSDRRIDNFFFGLTVATPAHKADWSSMLTASYVMKISSKGEIELMNWATSLENVALKAMGEYVDKTNADTAFDDSRVTRDDSTNVPDFFLDQSDVPNFESDN